MTKRVQGIKTHPVKHGYDKGEPFLRGVWWESTLQRFQVRTYRLWFCCPHCSKTMSLDEHSIAHDGSVAPTVVCPMRQCDFAEDIVLNAFVHRVREHHV